MVSRRNMLKTSLTAVFGACAVQTTSASEVQQKSQNNFDVVILGAGTGGLVTAIEAADLGLKPVVLEKMECSAGNSLYASGGIAAWGTSQQKEEGRNETKESFREDMMKVSEYRADPALVGAYVNHIPEDFEWLKKQGIKFSKIGKKPWPLNYRMHNVDGQGLTGGARLVRYLLEACEKRNIPIIYNTKAIELLTNDAGRVIGVRAQGDLHKTDYFAKDGVVIATGGFSANRELLCRYMGGPLSRLVLRGSPYVTGDNLMLTAPVGAQLVHIDQFHCGPIVEETHANPNFVIDAGQGIDVDVRGHRFMDEIYTYTQKSMATATKTPEELAKRMGVDPKVILSLFKEYNDALAANKLKELNPPCSLKEPQPLNKAPYYAFPFQGGITATFGGPKINANAQVINNEGRVIPGLYAVGNAAGGLFYGNYIGGTQLGGATVFGRIAARKMASLHKNN